jgi:hypothetical protein
MRVHLTADFENVRGPWFDSLVNLNLTDEFLEEYTHQIITDWGLHIGVCNVVAGKFEPNRGSKEK